MRNDVLTPREIQVINLASTGKTYKEVADELGLSDNTVRVHLTNIRIKLNASNTLHAFRIAISGGMIAV